MLPITMENYFFIEHRKDFFASTWIIFCREIIIKQRKCLFEQTKIYFILNKWICLLANIHISTQGQPLSLGFAHLLFQCPCCLLSNPLTLSQCLSCSFNISSLCTFSCAHSTWLVLQYGSILERKERGIGSIFNLIWHHARHLY